MSDQDLRALLAELHTRLKQARTLDPEAREMLATVSRDIEQALADDDASAVAAEPVEALAVRFEADHPSLAGVLRQIMDTLSKTGI
jgi:predicted component of type VI protein secretion system